MGQQIFSTVILLTLLLITGCVSNQTQTQGLSPKDPIIGTWQSGSSLTIIFFENGKASWNDEGLTWEKYDNTHYALSKYGVTYVFTYNPQPNTISTTTGGTLLLLKRIS